MILIHSFDLSIYLSIDSILFSSTHLTSPHLTHTSFFSFLFFCILFYFILFNPISSHSYSKTQQIYHSVPTSSLLFSPHPFPFASISSHLYDMISIYIISVPISISISISILLPNQPINKPYQTSNIKTFQYNTSTSTITKAQK